MIQKRMDLTENDIIHKSKIIIDKLLKLESFLESKFILCYYSTRGEVDTSILMSECEKRGKRLALPCIEKNQVTGKKRMVAREVNDWKNNVITGNFNILEPDRSTCKEIDPSEFDFIVVPGVAFDKSGNRIGFGAGYYDRYLLKVKKDCQKIGIAYDFQVFECLAANDHDVKMDLVISD